MSNEEIIRILTDLKEYFTTNNFLLSAIRQIGWWMATGLAYLTDLCADLYDWTFGLVDLTEWQPVSDFLDSYGPLLRAFLMMSLVFLGFLFVLGKDQQRPVLSGFLILAVVVTSSTYIFAALNDASILFKDAVAGNDQQEDAYTILNENLYDLVYMDKQTGLANLQEGQIPRYATLTKGQADMIDIIEVVNPNSAYLTTEAAKEILSQRVVSFQDRDAQLVAVSNGWGWNAQDDTDLGNEFYYRYTFHYGTYYLSILALLVIYLCLSYKNVRIIYELLVSRILAPIMAADLSSNQKAVKVLTAIRDGYFALCFTAITLRMFLLAQSYLQTRTDIPSLARGIILLFLAWATIDGANIMERISGVDAGLSSATGKLLTMYHLGKGVASAGATTVHGAGRVAELVGKAQKTKPLADREESFSNLKDSGKRTEAGMPETGKGRENNPSSTGTIDGREASQAPDRSDPFQRETLCPDTPDKGSGLEGEEKGQDLMDQALDRGQAGQQSQEGPMEERRSPAASAKREADRYHQADREARRMEEAIHGDRPREGSDNGYPKKTKKPSTQQMDRPADPQRGRYRDEGLTGWRIGREKADQNSRGFEDRSQEGQMRLSEKDPYPGRERTGETLDTRIGAGDRRWTETPSVSASDPGSRDQERDTKTKNVSVQRIKDKETKKGEY